ncbi:autotransporter outer membrane beta-barrel domain-containing protein [Aurantiacibacter odishensis]|uniref:autotransporter outer membrane beta-barrel domain-containing protein n=1 Tax=Aurantiacibacter odishensis TaxID=1155476 RepID=UPI000E762F74|nr:autotransporter outer membrane beta-barrel domain-containing protein [Aurantiacibacter odishensis]
MNRAFVTKLAGSISVVAASAVLAQAAHAQGAGQHAGLKVLDESGVVVTDGTDLLLPPPEGAYDSTQDVTGVGQMVTQPDPNSFAVGLCTGTLINPRTVIFAAHCVNDIAAEDYGAASGGVPISFGFSADNLPAARDWLGVFGNTPYQSNPDLNIYNVEQVWYDQRSVELGFLEADVALATLDTHADGVPIWTMLFSPLTEETHVLINGYGRSGTGSAGDVNGVDFRRRIAENVVSVLGSLNDRNEWLFGPGDYGLPQNLYQTDFDSPEGEAGFGVTSFDFDVFNGTALPNEGSTAGGDSGGPLIADEKFDVPVILGVLSGGSRFFDAQPSSSYGTTSFYQPLFMFWESIVANNSYVYVSAEGGTSNWNNPNHWVQDMDPAYAVEVDGELQNALPGFAQPGISGETPQFGEVCFQADCTDLADGSVPLESTGLNSIYVPGGPGTTGFVPDNVVGDPSQGIKARYYEVTLDQAGATILGDSKTIDRLNIAGQAALLVRGGGDLFVWGDYTQTGGLLDLDGSLRTGEAFINAGFLSGTGFFDPTYLTVAQGIIAPGDIGKPGTLTIAGDVILSSASVTIFDLLKRGGDTLAIVGDADNAGIASLGGTAAFALGTKGQTPRWGQSFEVLTAEGGVQNEFDTVVTMGVGVLYPELTYNEFDVTAEIKAGSFVNYLSTSGISDQYALAFGNAFDSLRMSNYADLSGIYGAIDVMGAADVAAAFGANSVAATGNLSVSDERQGSYVRTLVGDRLSMLGQKQNAGRIRLSGTTAGYTGTGEVSPAAASQMSFASNYHGGNMEGLVLPDHISGFMSVGYDRKNELGGTDAVDQSGTWNMAMGLEMAIDDDSVVGTAVGYSRGQRQMSGALASLDTSQMALYGSHQLGGGMYVGGQASFAFTKLDASSRVNSSLAAGFAVDSTASSYAADVELGYNHQLGDLTLTPRTRIGYSRYAVDGFQDSRAQFAMAVDGVSRAGVDWRTGLKVAGETRMGFASDWVVQPEIQAEYVRRLSGNSTDIDLHFAEAAHVNLNLPVNLHDASYGEVRGGVNFSNGPITIGAAVEARVAQDTYRDDRATVNFSFSF